MPGVKDEARPRAAQWAWVRSLMSAGQGLGQQGKVSSRGSFRSMLEAVPAREVSSASAMAAFSS